MSGTLRIPRARSSFSQPMPDYLSVDRLEKRFSSHGRAAFRDLATPGAGVVSRQATGFGR
jgi:hypothetical protein